MLLSFLTKAYRTIVNLFCWIFAILSGIGLAIRFYISFSGFGAAIGGFFVGFILGLLFEIFFVVPLMVLFEINEKLNILCKKEKNTNNDVAQDFKEVWICDKCGKENIDNQNLCSFCGENRFEEGVFL